MLYIRHSRSSRVPSLKTCSSNLERNLLTKYFHIASFIQDYPGSAKRLGFSESGRPGPGFGPVSGLRILKFGPC